MSTHFGLAVIMIAGCSSPFGTDATELKSIESPSGLMVLKPLVNKSRHDSAKYLCIAFKIYSNSGNLLHRIQTGASNAQKWAIGWFDDETIVLYSSDIGICAWKLESQGTIVQSLNPIPEELYDFGQRLRAYKYDD